MATATLRDAIEKSHDAAANTVADIKSHGEELQADLSGYKDEIMSSARSMYQSGKRSAQKLAHGAEEMYDMARDRALDGVRGATRTVKSHPVTTVALAAGVGLLVGAFLMWRR
jgi:ElaB/YqjD/DUF883 family membrane-anchored ribosome-binding protein